MLPSVIRVWRETESAEIANTPAELALWAAEGFHPREEDKSLAAGAAPAQPPVDAAGLRLDGPTLEDFVAAGYPADKYPPQGFAEVDSAALQQLKAEQAKAAEDSAAAAARAAAKESAAAPQDDFPQVPAPGATPPAPEVPQASQEAEKVPAKPSGKGKGQQA